MKLKSLDHLLFVRDAMVYIQANIDFSFFNIYFGKKGLRLDPPPMNPPPLCKYK